MVGTGGEDAESRAPGALRLHRYRPTAPPVAGPRGRRRAALAQHEGWQTAYFLSCEQAGGRLLAVENASGGYDEMRVFISYAWEDDEYRALVKSLAVRLREDGIDARLDAWHLAATVFRNRAQEGKRRSGWGDERRCLPMSFVVKHGIENNEELAH